MSVREFTAAQVGVDADTMDATVQGTTLTGLEMSNQMMVSIDYTKGGAGTGIKFRVAYIDIDGNTTYERGAEDKGGGITEYAAAGGWHEVVFTGSAVATIPIPVCIGASGIKIADVQNLTSADVLDIVSISLRFGIHLTGGN